MCNITYTAEIKPRYLQKALGGIKGFDRLYHKSLISNLKNGGIGYKLNKSVSDFYSQFGVPGVFVKIIKGKMNS